MKNKFKKIFVAGLSLLSITSLFSCSKQEVNIETSSIKTSVTNDVSTLAVDSNLDVSNMKFRIGEAVNTSSFESQYPSDDVDWPNWWDFDVTLPAGYYLVDVPHFNGENAEKYPNYINWYDNVTSTGQVSYTSATLNSDHISEYFDDCYGYTKIVYASAAWSFRYFCEAYDAPYIYELESHYVEQSTTNIDISNKVFDKVEYLNYEFNYVEDNYGLESEIWYYCGATNLSAGWYIIDAANFNNLHLDYDKNVDWYDINTVGDFYYTLLEDNTSSLSWDYFDSDNCYDNPYIVYFSESWGFSYYIETGTESVDFYDVRKPQIIKLKEADLQAPSIDGTNNFIVNVDNMLSISEIMSHITAIDDVDGPLEMQVESSTYDPSNRTIGTYQINAYAEDNSGNRSSITITVNVVDTTAPTATASNKTQPNNVKLSDAEILALVQASDNYYPSEQLTKTIISNEYISNYNRPGTYQVKVRVTDPSTRYTDVVFNITVNDVVKPTITGVNKTQPNNVKLSEAELLALFTASDDVSTNLRKELVVNDYSSNYSRPGSYNVTCRVYDEANNYSEATVTITVEDKVAPNINGTNKEQSYTTQLTQEELLALFTASDDITQNVRKEIILDEYTSSYATKGIYNVTCRAYDEANNYKDATITITVVDKMAPIMTGSDITLGNNKLASLEELKANITCIDGYDGEVDFSMEDIDGYSNNYTKVGNYRYKITAIDAAGNKMVQTITIHVVDRTSPEIWLDNYFIILEEGQDLTDEDIINFAAMTLNIDVDSIVSIEGEYSLAKVGVYALRVYTEDGNTQSIKLSVVESSAEQDEVASDKNYFEQLIDDYVQNWGNIQKWNWLHYTTILLALAVVVSLSVVIIKKRR